MPRRTEPDAQTAKLGARLRELRFERNMSLSDLENATQVLKGHLSSIEHGLAAITVPTIIRLADGLNLRPFYILVSPDDDDRDHIAELLRKLPAHEIVKLRRELVKSAKEAAKAAKTTRPQSARRRA